MFSILFAEEDMNKHYYKLNSITFKHSNCIASQKNRMCLNRKLTYPKTDIFNNTIAETLNMYIQTLKQEMEKETLKDYAVETDEDIDHLSHIFPYYSIESEVELLDYNEPIVTLKKYSYGSTGGPHPFHYTEYINYDTNSKKELALKDLVDMNNSKFLYVAEREYKESESLSPSDSLTQAGWLENKFEITTNFAVTGAGLLFFYNEYEVKPYADGSSSFLITYDKIINFIKPDTPLKKIAKKYCNSLSKKVDTKLMDDE